MPLQSEHVQQMVQINQIERFSKVLQLRGNCNASELLLPRGIAQERSFL